MDLKHPFSKDFAPSPLTLDRVMEGRPIAARDSRLLNLPVEILSVIIKYIDTGKEALASLALVNSDCRQLARSCQFRTVIIDFSPRSSSVLGILIREAAERFRSENGLTRRPSLGACIRRIKTNSDHLWKEVKAMKPRALEGHEDDAGDDGLRRTFSREQWTEAIGNISTRMTHVYEPSLALVISTLPHLGVLEWSKGADLDNHLLNSLATSTVKHLKLYSTLESELVAVQIDSGASWPLVTLDINVDWGFCFRYGRSSVDSSSLWNSLFQVCSSTLQRLKLSHIQFLDSQDKPMSFAAEFPCLRSLQIGDGTKVSEPTLRSLLRSEQLSTLVVNFSDPVIRETLDHIGFFASLETLVWTGSDIPDIVSLQALEHNTQLTAFGIHYGCSTPLLERVIPVLATFPNLKVLSMTWDETTIPDSSLASLSSLVSLEQLHISSGNQAGWRHNWFIDHDAIRAHLFPLRKLRRLTITRDSYRINNELTGEDIDAYYSFRRPDQDEWRRFIQQLPEDAVYDSFSNDAQTIWEDLHCRRMAKYAEKYAITFKELEWIHLGQLFFIFQNRADGKKVTVSLNRERDEDFQFRVLEDMFGTL
jgi:hypothetical protein